MLSIVHSYGPNFAPPPHWKHKTGMLQSRQLIEDKSLQVQKVLCNQYNIVIILYIFEWFYFSNGLEVKNKVRIHMDMILMTFGNSNLDFCIDNNAKIR